MKSKSMLTPSAISKSAIVAWAPAFLAAALHGTVLGYESLLSTFLIYPLVSGAILGTFTYFYKPQGEDDLEQIGIPETPGISLAFTGANYLPLAGLAIAMTHAQLTGSYKDSAWFVIAFGGLIGGEIGRLARLSR